MILPNNIQISLYGELVSVGDRLKQLLAECREVLEHVHQQEFDRKLRGRDVVRQEPFQSRLHCRAQLHVHAVTAACLRFSAS